MLYQGKVARMLIFHQCILKPAVRFQVPKTSAKKYSSNEKLEPNKLVYFKSVQSQHPNIVSRNTKPFETLTLFYQGRFLQKHPPQELNQCDQVSRSVDLLKLSCDDRQMN